MVPHRLLCLPTHTWLAHPCKGSAVRRDASVVGFHLSSRSQGKKRGRCDVFGARCEAVHVSPVWRHSSVWLAVSLALLQEAQRQPLYAVCLRVCVWRLNLCIWCVCTTSVWGLCCGEWNTCGTSWFHVHHIIVCHQWTLKCHNMRSALPYTDGFLPFDARCCGAPAGQGCTRKKTLSLWGLPLMWAEIDRWVNSMGFNEVQGWAFHLSSLVYTNQESCMWKHC